MAFQVVYGRKHVVYQDMSTTDQTAALYNMMW